MIGSILVCPKMSAHADVGARIFFGGSIMYLVVTCHDMAEVVRHNKRRKGPSGFWDRMEAVAAISYVTGTIFFMVGSIFFLSTVGYITAAAWCFILGILPFVIGATMNVVQVINAEDRNTLELLNLTALAYVVGSVLFAVASVPYLWDFQSAADQELDDGFLAWQYLFGSMLLLLGGVFNYWHAYAFIKRRMEPAAHEQSVTPR